MPAATREFGVMTRSERLTSLFREAWQSVPASTKNRVSWLRSARQLQRQTPRNLFVVSDLFDDELAEQRRQWHADQLRYLLFVDEASPDNIADIVIRLGIRSKERIVFVEFKDKTHCRALLVRWLSGLATQDDDGRVIKAVIDDDQLVLVSPTFQELRVPLALLSDVRDEPPDDWRQFELDPFGEFLYWPKLDVHMGWSQLQQLVDPKARLRPQQRSARFNERYGAAIRARREESGLGQGDIVGLSDRTLRRIEIGETRATVNALEKLAAAHDLELNEYLDQLAKKLQVSKNSIAGKP